MIDVQNYIGGKHVSLNSTIDDVSPLDDSIIAKSAGGGLTPPFRLAEPRRYLRCT